MQIRKLRADEIEVRPQDYKNGNKTASFLLYMNSRKAMNILDETFGVFGWSRTHECIDGSLFCTISIYDEKSGVWIAKQDIGTESSYEKQKGESSDSFKRACVVVGIGRELYTGPAISIFVNDNDVYNGKLSSFFKLHVSKIDYDNNGTISDLELTDQTGKVRFSMVKGIVLNIKGSGITNKPVNNQPKPQTQTQTQPAVDKSIFPTMEEALAVRLKANDPELNGKNVAEIFKIRPKFLNEMYSKFTPEFQKAVRTFGASLTKKA